MPAPVFSLFGGGPFGRAFSHVWMLALFAWLPLVLGEGIRLALGMKIDPTLLDISVHVRLLVAMPVLGYAARLVDAAAKSAVHSVYVGHFCEHDKLAAIVARTERLRDAWWPESLMLVLAVIGGQLALWGVTGATGVFHGGTGVSAWSFPHLWYVTAGLPLAQFVLYRWLWRWLLWAYLLARLSRQPLRGLATHPDGAAGFACLARPVSGFAGFGFAVGSVLASAWGSQIVWGKTTAKENMTALLVYLVTLAALALSPLLLFCGHLYRLRRRTIAQYGDFAADYAHGFHAKWIERASGRLALGSPDIQSFNDLAGVFRTASNTRFFVFGVRPILAVWTMALVPFLPLYADVISVETALGRILTAVLGGIP